MMTYAIHERQLRDLEAAVNATLDRYVPLAAGLDELHETPGAVHDRMGHADFLQLVSGMALTLSLVVRLREVSRQFADIRDTVGR